MYIVVQISGSSMMLSERNLTSVSKSGDAMTAIL